MNHWVALYLSGQYPGQYRLPNRFDILLKIRQIDGTNFGDSIIGLLSGKGDLEFYNSLLEAYEALHGDEALEDLLDALDVPSTVRSAPLRQPARIDEAPDLEALSRAIMKMDETDFSRFVVMPILQAMGYQNVEYKGKVNQTDYGTDFCVVRFISPGGILHYAGVQVKAKKFSDGDTSDIGKDLKDLIEEVDTAFHGSHRLSTGEEVRISEMLVLNSRDISQTTRDKFFRDGRMNMPGRKVRLLAHDGILALIQEFHIKVQL